MKILRVITLVAVIVFMFLEKDAIEQFVRWCQQTPISAAVIIGGLIFLFSSGSWSLARRKRR